MIFSSVSEKIALLGILSLVIVSYSGIFLFIKNFPAKASIVYHLPR